MIRGDLQSLLLSERQSYQMRVPDALKMNCHPKGAISKYSPIEGCGFSMMTWGIIQTRGQHQLWLLVKEMVSSQGLAHSRAARMRHVRFPFTRP